MNGMGMADGVASPEQEPALDPAFPQGEYSGQDGGMDL